MTIAVVFATLSGNTQAVATELYSFLTSKQYKVQLFDIQHVSADELKQFDLVFLGCSTWGDGDMNLILDIFFDDAKNACHSCDGTKFAIFSLGDTLYENFAMAGDIAQNKIQEMYGNIVATTIKIDGYPTENLYTQVQKWALSAINESQHSH
ncbi:MAG: flavodoxin domain-containing protein [Candidatus Magasanikbacteria bacterium]|nr:flavodoxin domain-containing protein [Candidatus Magasanikbacteria bacterium]